MVGALRTHPFGQERVPRSTADGMVGSEVRPALVAVLDPDVVLRANGGAGRARQTVVIHTAREVAAQAVLASRLAPFVRPALINGTAGAVIATVREVLPIMAFTVANGRIVAMDVLQEPERLAGIDRTILDD